MKLCGCRSNRYLSLDIRMNLSAPLKAAGHGTLTADASANSLLELGHGRHGRGEK